MKHPYRSHASVVGSAPRSGIMSVRFLCRLGLHKFDAITVVRSAQFICPGMEVRFYCACGARLGEKHVSTKRAVYIVVGAGWDSMGGSYEEKERSFK